MKYFYTYLATCASFIQAHVTTVQPRTSLIYQRFYMIKRLEKSCELLKKDQSIGQSVPLHLLQPEHFKFDDIRSVVEIMKKKECLEPFFGLWEDFCAYKYVYDNQFKREFVELVFSLYDLINPTRIKRIETSLEGLLFSIDEIVAGEHIFRVQDVPDEVSTDFIAKRFYIIKRLQKSVQFLEHLHAHNFEFLHTKNFSGNSQLMEEIEHFHHDRVRESIIQMFQTKKLEPLLQLYEEVKQYRFAQDESFLQEMLMNIFLVYKTILFKQGSQCTDPVILNEMNHVLEIYEHLNSMPLDQTLEAIDEVTDRLIAFQAENSAHHASYLRWGLPALCMCFCAGIYYVLHQG